MHVSQMLRAMFLIPVLAAPALSQTLPPPITKTVNLAGPRFGLTSLSDGVVKTLKDDYSVDVQPMITQFGWQFEKQFRSKDSGFTAVNEWVFLLGGLEQGVALPSASWIVGLRTSEGAEFGVGPNLTAAGVALAVAAGVTFHSGAMNIPVNVAMVPSKAGMRVSMLTGFNFRRR